MEPAPLIEAGALRALLEQQRTVLLDCRFDLAAPQSGRRAYLESHIPGAHYADLNLDLSAPVDAHSGRHPLPDPIALARKAGEWGIEEKTPAVVYDEANAGIAARAWWLLRWIGVPRVAVLNGGFAAWRAAGGALAAGAGPAPAAVTWAPRLRAGAWLAADEVAAAVRKADHKLIDARAAERFAGLVEPIDPIAGHVPGALNHPFTANLDASGRLLPAPILAARWRALLAGTRPENVVSMCGSGVTACHNLLAMEAAGLPGAKLYAGSWSEWIRDPRRPVARA